MASAYKPPAFDKKYEEQVNTNYYDNAIKDYTATANANRTAQITEAQNDKQGKP